jgi:glycosyltransferase involved in cell wall biosynthesis
VLAEANAAGVPVIAMDLGSCREVIKDGVTGFLAASVKEAAECLERVPQIDRSACRQRVEECFSMETMVEQYERVYSKVLELEAMRVALEAMRVALEAKRAV